MQRLFVLYDDRCGLCTWARRWLARQPTFLELVFVPKGSAWANRLFPELSSPEAVDDLVVVSDDGGVYREARAWIMCLYALQEYRDWSSRLAQPLLYPWARQTFALLSTGRQRLSAWLDLASEAEIAEALSRFQATRCDAHEGQGGPLDSAPQTHCCARGEENESTEAPAGPCQEGKGAEPASSFTSCATGFTP